MFFSLFCLERYFLIFALHIIFIVTAKLTARRYCPHILSLSFLGATLFGASIFFETYILSYQLKLIKMSSKLANLNNCAVPFLSRAAVNLRWYYYISYSTRRLSFGIHLLIDCDTSANVNIYTSSND